MMSKRLRCSERVAATNRNSNVAATTETFATANSHSDKSKIMKKWWKEHRAANKAVVEGKAEVEKEVVRLHEVNEIEKMEVERLREENERLKKMIEHHQCHGKELHQLNESLTRDLMAAKGMPPFLKKEKGKASILPMICHAILFIFNVVMFRTQSITRLRVLVEAVFDSALFGSFATGKVIQEISTKYARQTVFLPWKVLRSIDLAINGGMNFSGVEALRKAEGLAPYERGFLPSRTSIQSCAAQLHDLGQELIPFKKVDCQLGEIYQFDYEKVVRFLLRAFLLYDIAQREL
jgi:transposase-like protein